MLHPAAMTAGTDASIRADLSPRAPARGPAPMGNLAIVRRLVGGCMMVTAGMTAALSWLLDPAIKLIFLDKRSDMLAVIPLAVLGVIVIRAVTTFIQQALVDTVGERAVAAVQRDLFDSLVH